LVGNGLTWSIVPARGLRFGRGWCRDPPENLRSLLLAWVLFLCSTGDWHSFVPTWALASAARRRRQGWPLGHRRRRRGLDGAEHGA